jgi:type IV secretion system protein VirB1
MDFQALAQECAPWVAPQTMAAIVKTESGFRPYAINVNGRAQLERQPATKSEATVTAKWLIANGYNIDLGLGQVNSVNLSKTGLSVEDAFDPCKNLAAAATILHWNYQAASRKVQGEQAALHAAISAYNTGSFTRGFSNGYVQKVVMNAANSKGTVAAPPKPSEKPIPLRKAKPQKEDKQAEKAVMVATQTENTPELRSKGPNVYNRNASSVMVY